MGEFKEEKYIDHLDHYLEGGDYHLWSHYRIEKQLLDVVPIEYKYNHMEAIKDYIVQNIVETVRDKIIDKCTVIRSTYDEFPVMKQYETDVWIFSKSELELLIMEVKEEVLRGKL